MKKVLVSLAVVGGIILLIGGFFFNQYNRLVKAEESVTGSWAQVENVLQRRADLIPNLVATVKGYAAQEQTIFVEVANARSRLLAARGPAESATANQGFESALGRLLAISERYPDLKSNQNFIQLQDELAGTENRIAVERMRYNDVVRDYNARIRSFPTNVVARVFDFDKHEYFEAAAGAETVPTVDFSG